MNTLYPPEVKIFVNTRPWPKGLIFDVIEYEHHLGFRFYRDNFESFDGEGKQHIASIVQEVMNKIRNLGIPCYMEKMEKGI